MNRFCCLATCGLALLQTLVAGVNVPYYLKPAPFTRRDLSVTKVQVELGPLLSNTSALFGPSDARYDDAIERFDEFLMPDVEIVAQPGQESDVSTIVGAICCCSHSGPPADKNTRSNIAMKIASISWRSIVAMR